MKINGKNAKDTTAFNETRIQTESNQCSSSDKYFPFYKLKKIDSAN